MTREHLRLAFPRKPEYMGWGYHWTRFDHNCEQLTDTDFSFTNYDEAQRRLEAYRQLGARPKPCCTRSSTKPARLSTSWSTTPCAAPN